MGNNENVFGPAIRMGGHQGWNGNENEEACCPVRNRSALSLNNADEQNETHIYYETCEGAKEVCVTSECRDEENIGRVLDVNMTLRNVCPGRRSAVGVHLVELDEQGAEYARGFRSLTVPAHNAGCNRDVQLPSMRFILPEDVSVAGNGSRRHFVVRTTNHYLEDAANGCGYGCGCNSCNG